MSNIIKLYDWNDLFDFGQCFGKTILEVFNTSPSYVEWCFKNVDTFCISDEIFKKLPIVIYLQNDKQNKIHLIKLENLHSTKKNKFKNITAEFFKESKSHADNKDYDWLKEAAGTDDPEIMNDVYWNLD